MALDAKISDNFAKIQRVFQSKGLLHSGTGRNNQANRWLDICCFLWVACPSGHCQKIELDSFELE